MLVGRSVSRLGLVTAEAYHHDDLHHLVNRLNPAQADAVRAVVLQLVTNDSQGAKGTDVARPDDWPPAWFGSITAGEPDIAERTRDILRAEYGRS
jgi:hypothetical protein